MDLHYHPGLQCFAGPNIHVYMYIYIFIHDICTSRRLKTRVVSIYSTCLWPHDIQCQNRRSLVIYAYIHLDIYIHGIYLFQNVNSYTVVFPWKQVNKLSVFYHHLAVCLVAELPRNSTQIVITWVLPQASTAVIQHRRRVQICQFFWVE